MSYCVSVMMSSEGSIWISSVAMILVPFQTMKVEFVTIYFLLHDFLAVDRILYFYENGDCRHMVNMSGSMYALPYFGSTLNTFGFSYWRSCLYTFTIARKCGIF